MLHTFSILICSPGCYMLYTKEIRTALIMVETLFTHTHTHAHLHTRARTHTSTHKHTHKHTHSCMHTEIIHPNHTQMHTHAHTSMQTHITWFFVASRLSHAWLAPALSTVQQSLGYSNCPAQWNVYAPVIGCPSPVVASVRLIVILNKIKAYLYFSSCHITYFPLQNNKTGKCTRHTISVKCHS